MSAIDNKHLIELLQVKHESGTSSKTGKAWEMFKAQCIVRAGDSIEVGVLNLPKDLRETPPGKYLAEFTLRVDFDNKIVPSIVKLHPFGDSSKPASKSAAAGSVAA